VKVITRPECVETRLVDERNQFKEEVRVIELHATVIADSQIHLPNREKLPCQKYKRSTATSSRPLLFGITRSLLVHDSFDGSEGSAKILYRGSTRKAREGKRSSV